MTTQSKINRCFPYPVGLPVLLLLWQGCGPTLVKSEEYTPRRVREIKFSDSCQLQPYFDANPEQLFKKSEVAMGAENNNKTAGKITFAIKPGPQADTFFRLVDASYTRVPQVNREAAAEATVPFLNRRGQVQMPIGSEIQVQSGEREFTLPYSPCMGAFFFGRNYYAVRARLMHPGRRAYR